MKILIIEDERDLMDNILAYFSAGDFVCESASSKAEALDKLGGFNYDVVILDIMLPDGNGLQILNHIRNENPDTGVLIISAKNALDDRLRGLDLGADDYLTKPFHLSELNARIRAIFRRRKLQGQTVLQYNEIAIHTSNHEVLVNDASLELTLKVYELLLFFVTNKNRVLTKQAIAEHLWGDNVDYLQNFDFVYQHIKNLRKKIMANDGKDYIKTIYGLGYKFTDK